MNFDNYMFSLLSEIKNKRAKKLIASEIKEHIEEQAQSYREMGFSEENALNEAVAQMGEPLSVGKSLNAMHQPSFPYELFIIAVIINIMVNINNACLVNIIMFSTISFVLAFIDYNIIAKCGFVLFIMLISAVFVYTGFARLYPVILACMIYKFRNTQPEGLIKCMLSAFMIIFIIHIKGADVLSIQMSVIILVIMLVGTKQSLNSIFAVVVMIISILVRFGYTAFFDSTLEPLPIIFMLLFVFKAFAIVSKQLNRLGYIIGISCGITIISDIFFGFSYNYTLSVSDNIINAVIFGLIFSIYRNTYILSEDI